MQRLILSLAVIALAVALVRGAVVAPAPTAVVPAPTAVAPGPIARPAAPAAPAPVAAAPVASARPETFTLSLTDADLTRAATAAFPQTVSGVTVSDPVVRVQPNGVRLVATAKVLFGTTQFVLMATPVVRDGSIDVRVDSATLAGIGVPDSTKAQIADTMRRTVSPLVPANVRVGTVTLTAGNLNVVGVN
jgi:hypothetical protein